MAKPGRHAEFTQSLLSRPAESNKPSPKSFNMDDEITVLETQLDKAKQIKQAMMQELLTGRIRLI